VNMFSDAGSTPAASTTSEQSAYDSVSAVWRKHPSTPLLFLFPKKAMAFLGDPGSPNEESLDTEANS